VVRSRVSRVIRVIRMEDRINSGEKGSKSSSGCLFMRCTYVMWRASASSVSSCDRRGCDIESCCGMKQHTNSDMCVRAHVGCIQQGEGQIETREQRRLDAEVLLRTVGVVGLVIAAHRYGERA
jgi:hypothetical protein